MSAAFLVLPWVAPLLAMAVPRAGRWSLPVAALPAVAGALLVPVGATLHVPWLLLGVHLALDAAGRLLLMASALAWLFAGLYAALSLAHDRTEGRFRLFFLLAMAGNLLLIVAADMMTFYFGFALMGLAAYGLVVHRRSQRARRAGRLYLGWTLTGEVSLFTAVMLIAAGADSLRFADLAGQELPRAAVALIVFGFGVKLALPGLHVWLPLTYSAAPAPAAAVLSGPMITAGLLGWLRFLPPGVVELDGWGALLVPVGVVGIALGVLAGIAQSDPRAVLGYSSIAKMGLMTAAFGSALLRPEAAAAVFAALLLFAVHHLLVKSALFLGVGEWERVGGRPWLLAGLTAAALALAGAPLTGGTAVKTALAGELTGAGADLSLLFLASSVGTVLLMARFFWLLGRTRIRSTAGRFDTRTLTWLGLVFLALALPLSLAGPSLSMAGSLPLALGLGLGGLAWALSHRRPALQYRIPPGDILHLMPDRRLKRLLCTVRVPACAPALPRWRPAAADGATASFAVAGLSWLALFVLLLSALLVPLWGWR
jgi:hydrogenase-4 component B